jgi:hypothetical protein
VLSPNVIKTRPEKLAKYLGKKIKQDEKKMDGK